ncbi:MAG: hypothetical protein HOQ29_12035 [Acidobacteria bacterium]|nr:hypothetical protein [Acidobacteriota bacterium]
MTITLGNLIQIATFIIAIVMAYQKLRERLAVIETKLDPLWGKFIGRRRTSGTMGQDS